MVERLCGRREQTVADEHGVGNGNQGVERCRVIVGQAAGHILEGGGFVRQQAYAWQVVELADDMEGVGGESESLAPELVFGADEKTVEAVKLLGVVSVKFFCIHRL